MGYLGLGLIVCGIFISRTTDLGLILSQLGLAILIYIPFRKNRFSIFLVSTLFLTFNLSVFLDLLNKINFDFLLLIVWTLGIAVGIRKIINSKNKM